MVSGYSARLTSHYKATKKWRDRRAAVENRILPRYQIPGGCHALNDFPYLLLAANVNNSNEQYSHSHYPRRLLNFITESNAANVIAMHPRRAMEYFKPPKID